MNRTARVLITGNGGSGKTWLAEQLSSCLSLPLVRLDDLYWADDYGGKGRDKQEVFDEVRTHADRDAWVIEGVYGWLLPAALPRATEFVFLDLGVDECVANLRQRGIQGGGTEASFNEMLRWVEEYPTRNNWNSRLAHQRLWERFDGPKEVLSSREAVERYLALRAGRSGD